MQSVCVTVSLAGAVTLGAVASSVRTTPPLAGLVTLAESVTVTVYVPAAVAS
jgi:hypothetical protein